jgi:hypothetical protein
VFLNSYLQLQDWPLQTPLIQSSCATDLVHFLLIVGTVTTVVVVDGTVSCCICSLSTLLVLSEVSTEEEDDAGTSGSTRRLTDIPSSAIILNEFLEILGVSVPTGTW